jgi:hypothetical protein
MANQITVSDSGTVQVAIQQLGDVQVQISRTALLGVSGYSGMSGYSGAGGTRGFYGSFLDTTDQPMANITQEQVVGINTTAESDGISIVSGNRITFANEGTYSLTYSMQFTNTDNNTIHYADVWLKKNGNNVAESNSRFDIPGAHSGLNGHLIGTVNYVFTVTAGDYYQLYWNADSTTVSIESLPADTSPTTPATPGIILTVAQVMYGQSGFSGKSGYSGATGPSGTSGYSGGQGATGTSGFSGASGASGQSGTNGSNGASGASGISGYSGSGVSGYSGATGPSGISGYSGAAGSAGASGTSGYSGANGTNGASGVSGYSGQDGSAGASGASGYSGQDGASGLSGFSGIDGAAGASGISGFSGAAGTASPGGANTEVQYNDNGSLNASNTFTFNNTSNLVSITNLRVNSGNITLGANSATTSQGANAIAIGYNTANLTQGAGAVAIGIYAGANTQGANSVAIGVNAGITTQSASSVAIGPFAGETVQGSGSIAIGLATGRNNQGANAIAIGRGAGNISQATDAIAIGRTAGFSGSGNASIAIGTFAGNLNLGSNSIAIGFSAGRSNTPANTTVINATGANLNVTTGNAFYIKPVRNASASRIVNYNTTSGEIAYDSNVAAGGYGSFASPTDGQDTMLLTSINKANMNDIRIVRQIDTANAGGLNTISVYRTGYDGSNPSPVQSNDIIFSMYSTAYSDSGNIFVDTGGFKIEVDQNDNAGNITTIASYFQGTYPGTVNFNYDSINFNGISNLGSNSNVVITGGSNGDVLSTDGAGNLSWQPQSGGGGGETFNVFLLAGM